VAESGTGVLAGKVAVVTGGSRGLGREMVLAYAEAGAAVVVASRKLDACESLAAEVTDRFGVDALAVAANVSHWDDCDALAAAAYDRFGEVDVLVNNAGMSPLYPSLDTVTEELWDKVVATNLRGPFRLGALFGTKMAAANGGSIINVSSVAAVRPGPNELPYGAAKAGLEALTLGFMRAFGPKVRVNTIRCGPFRTDISKAWGDISRMEEMARVRMPLGRIGEPEDVVGAALFLASDASVYCTGTTIGLDGGGSR
jgi:NAD(P)-dependent dehydrogenase (short-subunit alcohol dehydrogenase family)